MKKIIMILFLTFIAFGLVACGDEPETKEYTVSYINEHLDGSRYQKLEYTKQITLESVLLLEVKYTSELNGSEFVNKTVTKKLADITSNEEYEEVTEETMSKTIEDPITLNLDETYFESVIITEKSFIGKVNSEKVEEVIGIKNAGSVEIRIELTDDLKVNTIEIKYTDLGSGYLVTMKSKYTF